MEAHNPMPRSEFAGLSAVEMSRLRYHPFEPGSPIRFRNDILADVLDKIGFLRLVEELLTITKRDGSIKLTAKLGALPRQTLLELYDHHFIGEWPLDEGLFKLRVEDDSTVMRSLRLVAYLAGLVRKIHGKLVLTKLGEEMLSAKSRQQLFELVVRAFTMKFNWAYNDRYPDFPLCRDACAFSLYLVARFGSKAAHKDFYAQKFLTAFPDALEEFEGDEWSTPKESFRRCYRVRTFERFLEWFSLVDVRLDENDDGRHRSLVKKSDIVDRIFVLN
jgi:hypothetical protein